MFLILLLAWVLKISTPSLQAEGVQSTLVHSLGEIIGNTGLGPIPGWIVIACVAVFYVWLLIASRRALDDADEGGFGQVHV